MVDTSATKFSVDDHGDSSDTVVKIDNQSESREFVNRGKFVIF
jgi:hypothetical protein